MSTLRNTKTGQTYEVPDADALEATRENPDLEVADGATVSMAPGSAATVSPGFLSTQHGYVTARQSDLEQVADARRQEAQHDNLGSTLRAGIGGAVSTLDAGLWKPWEEDARYHP